MDQADRAAVAAMIDHTLLTPQATAADVAALCAEAADLGTYAVCVSPSLTVAARDAKAPGTRLAVVCGFPSGAHTAATKAYEAGLAAEQGADEIDMVIDLACAKSGQWAAVREEVAAVRAATTDIVLKVIIESAVLTDSEIVAACQAAQDAGADFVKTSTGMHPAGGATTEAVRLMAQTVAGRLQVKASGGILVGADAIRMIDAGASRLGCSASRAILDGLSGADATTAGSTAEPAQGGY